jgi:hypothetical protein
VAKNVIDLFMEKIMTLTFNKNIFILSFFIICFMQGCADNTSPEQKALDLAINSHVVNKDLSVDRVIKDFIKEKGDDVKPLGWSVEKIADKRYLVSYKYSLHSFSEGIGERGFFFEVDLTDSSVTDKTIEYTKKLPPLTKAYSNEKEIFNDVTGQTYSPDAAQQ